MKLLARNGYKMAAQSRWRREWFKWEMPGSDQGGLLQKSEEHTARLLKSHVRAVFVGTDKADYEVEVKFAGGNV